MTEKLRERLGTGLRDALKARDAAAIAALRSALAAIDNAEAVPSHQTPTAADSWEHVAGSVAGLRTTEGERRVLTPAQLDDIVRAEITDRREAADTYTHAGRHERAEELRRQADVLADMLDHDPSRTAPGR